MERECPTRFEKLDPRPLEAALTPSKPETMKEIVSRYIRNQLSPFQDDTGIPEGQTLDWDDFDEDEMPLTDSQIMVMAESGGFGDLEEPQLEALEPQPPTPVADSVDIVPQAVQDPQ